MIFILKLTTPFVAEYFKSFWCKTIQLAEYKFFEAQSYFHSKSLVDIEFRWTTKTDHAGVTIDVVLFGLGIVVSIYDCRHYDDDAGCWEVHNEVSE